MPAFPLAGPHRASGLASNVVRRSAAHNFGKNATPAVGKSRLGRRGFQQSHVHPRMRHPLHDTEVSEQIASVRSTEPTVIKIGAPIPLDQSRMMNQIDMRTGCSQGMSTTSASFSADPEGTSERRLAAPLLGLPTHSKLPWTTLEPVPDEVTFERRILADPARASGPVSTMKKRLSAPVWYPGRPCNLFPHLRVRAADIQQAGRYADPSFAPGHERVARLTARRRKP
jgi:hypothetical protein